MDKINFHPQNDGRSRLALWGVFTAVLMVALAYAAWVFFLQERTPVRLVVYASSVQQETLLEGIFPAFKAKWQASSGRELSLEGVFDSSESLARQINLGAPADIAIFTHTQPVTTLRYGKKIDMDAQAIIIGCTPMVIVTRPGNPKNIMEFSDLAQSGLNLIHANPVDSGFGQWALLAEYGSVFVESQDAQIAEQRLMSIWKNVRVMTPSARAAMTLFEIGAGDALVTCEQDARLAIDRGADLEIVVPTTTVFAQPVAILIDGNISHNEREAAEAFLEFLVSAEARQIFASYYLYGQGDICQVFPGVANTFTVDDMGGWHEVFRNVWLRKIEPFLDVEITPSQMDIKH
jgi:sulfate/thiosulfate transport system substrate-binding protein